MGSFRVYSLLRWHYVPVTYVCGQNHRKVVPESREAASPGVSEGEKPALAKAVPGRVLGCKAFGCI